MKTIWTAIRKKFHPPTAVAVVIIILMVLFTVQVFLGSVIIMAVSRLLFMKRQERNDHERFHALREEYLYET